MIEERLEFGPSIETQELSPTSMGLTFNTLIGIPERGSNRLLSTERNIASWFTGKPDALL